MWNSENSKADAPYTLMIFLLFWVSSHQSMIHGRYRPMAINKKLNTATAAVRSERSSMATGYIPYYPKLQLNLWYGNIFLHRPGCTFRICKKFCLQRLQRWITPLFLQGVRGSIGKPRLLTSRPVLTIIPSIHGYERYL